VIEFHVNQIRYEAVGGQEPGLRLILNVGVKITDSPTATPSVGFDIEQSVTIGGIHMLSWWEDGLRTGEDLRQYMGREMKLFVSMDREAVRRIEAVRTNDVSVSVRPVLRYFPQGGAPLAAYPQGQTQLEISQTKWLDALAKTGHLGGWAVEVPRPSVEGMDGVVKLLDSALTRIQTYDAPGAVADCRKAWDAADSFLDARPGERDRVIDGLSKGEKDEPSKSARIRETRKCIDKLTQIGPHSDLYEVTMDDALLAYRLTATTVAYLGKKVRDAEVRSG
jgi:hypothetical protein